MEVKPTIIYYQNNMNIKFLSLLAFASLIGGGNNALASDFWSQDFNSGIPKTFTVIDRDGAEVISANYKNVSTSGAWVAGRTDGYGYSAMSLSNTDNETMQDNWLITEPIEISSENSYLRWEGRSIINHRQESYRVMISTSDDNPESFSELTTIDAESANWNTHLESLSEFVGQSVRIAFVCNSVDKFILAIDNIAVGELNDEKILVSDLTQRFCGDVGTVNINGHMINAGKSYDVKNIVASVKYNDGTGVQTYSTPVDAAFLINEKLEYSFDVPVEVGKQTEYTLSLETSDGQMIELLSDNIICSYFQRKMVVEKGTGTWCNGCPDGSAYMHYLKDRYKDELIYVSVHVRDIMESDYQNGVSRWLTQVPLIIINRIDGDGVLGNSTFKQSGKFNYEPFNEIALNPTYVGIKSTAEKSDDIVKIHADVEFAKEYDNSSDIYRMCYAIVENTVHNSTNTGYNQVNNCNFNTVSAEYYYLPSVVPASLMYYDNVARGGSLSKTGVESSFNASIISGDKYSFDYELSIPESVIDKDNISVLVFVMNTKTSEILNADKINLKKQTSIMNVPADDSEIDMVISRKQCKINFTDDSDTYSMKVVSIDGKILKSISNQSINNNIIDLSDIEGFVILSVSHGGKVKSVKAIL